MLYYSYSTDSSGGTLEGESADVQGSSGEQLLPLKQVLLHQPQPRLDRSESLFNLTVKLASPGQDCHQFNFHSAHSTGLAESIISL